ncbi:hypothetical protein [Porcipelethomonas sp.]|uniref:hypothetical protein n=1 Tax=Porcipelethomonas sp. TaxID=2981675 RepID=UPI003EF711E6
MTEKKKYVSAEIEVIYFQDNDIIMTSLDLPEVEIQSNIYEESETNPKSQFMV